MFGGVGTEVLWHTSGSRLAIGADVNYVRQRDFDTRFSFRDYDVWTGHLTTYWHSPYENINVAVSAGQFLAGDKGVEININKQFRSGVFFGIYAAFTDVSSEEYGEGSFTKGFYISVPYELFSVKPTRERFNLNFQPLTRDGGQKLSRRHYLYSIAPLY